MTPIPEPRHPQPGAGSGSVSVVDCSVCAGVTFTIDRCRCIETGDAFIIEGERTPGGAYRDCLVCRGTGSVARGCRGCGETGKRRAQVVLSVVNLDTGRVASVSIVPGVIDPEPWPEGVGWQLPVAPLIHQLAASVGAGSWRNLVDPGRPPDGPIIYLPHTWRPNLPESNRRALEARALAGESAHPWYVYLGRTAPDPPPALNRKLGRFCRVADLLRLDLIVEARRSYGKLCWSIRYEIPGSDIPPEPGRWSDYDLSTAVAAATIDDALYGVEERGRNAPAHYPSLNAPSRVELAGELRVEVDQIERRVISALTELETARPAAGAQAIRRDGRWWYTRLRAGGTHTRMVERSTGQIVRRQTTILLRTWEPPMPAWLGEPIPHHACPDCDPKSRLRKCICTRLTPPVAPACPTCHGAGWHPTVLRCDTCTDSHRVYHGSLITISDLTHHAIHLVWKIGDPNAAPAPLVASQPGGKPVHQLPQPYRLGHYATILGARPADLVRADGNFTLDQDLAEGTVTVNHAGADPYAQQIANAARGQPGARLILHATAPNVPTLPQLIRALLGLRLTVTVTLADHSPKLGDPRAIQGESWDITANPADQPPAPAYPPTQHTPEAAIAYCLDFLETTTDEATPDDPHQPVPVPQTPHPVEVGDPTPLIRRLAHQYAGQPVAVHYRSDGCRLFLRERDDDVRHLATAETLTAALTALGLLT